MVESVVLGTSQEVEWMALDVIYRYCLYIMGWKFVWGCFFV